jgi:PAS domain S-box-containing protein
LKSKKKNSFVAVELRQRAEEILLNKTTSLLPPSENQLPEDLRRLYHELQVHQIELEMQNDELRHTRAELSAAQARYFDFYDIAPVGYLTVAARGIILDANLTIATFLGLPRQTLVGQPLTRFIVREDQGILYRHQKLLFENHQAASCELHMRHKDNSIFYALLDAITVADANGEPLCRLVISDITAQKLAEQTLRESEERFHTMANAIPQLAWVARTDGYIYWYNDRWFEYTGTTLEEMEGWGWERVHDPDMLPSVRDRWKNSIATGMPFDMEFPLRGADGVFHPFLTRVMPVKDSHGKVLQWVGTNTDILERKKTEIGLRRLYEQTAHDAHLKTELLNEVNHRVKNNLMMVLGLILAEKDRASADITYQAYASFDKFWSRINGLLHVHQMLSASKWMPISVTRLAERISEAVLASGHESRLVVNLSIEHTDIEISAKQAANLAIVLNELVTNSIKYAFNNIKNPSILVASKMEDSILEICFKDNGCGYPIDVLDDKRRNVGLRLIHQLIEQMDDGRVELFNDNGAVTSLYWKIES